MKKYGTIVVDPPWQYGKSKQDSYARGTAEKHYPTMSIREIAELGVASIAAPNSHLYLWVTVPRLYGDRNDRSFTPIDLMEAWGFKFKTMLTWYKPARNGTGWYFRGSTEHVLFGVMGAAPIPSAIREPNVIVAPRARHSQKPQEFYDLVQRVSPGPYVDLFARIQREGWDAWGDEVEGGVQLATVR